MRHLPLALASLLILPASIGIRPAAASSVSADAEAFDTSGSPVDSESTTSTQPVEATVQIPGEGFSSGKAHGFAEPGFGVLSASASASASTVIADPAQYVNDPHQVFARGFGTAEFTDTITVHSSSDSFVEVMIGAAIHADVVSTGYDLSYWCSAGNIGRFENTEPFANLFVLGVPGGDETLGRGACPRASDRSSFSRHLFLAVEIPITFEMILTTAAEASPYFGQSPLDFSNVQMNVSTTADASNTGFFFFHVLTPGGSYTSESGTVYLTELPAAAVPQPVSVSLLGGGLIALAALRRRPRRGSRSSVLSPR